MPTLNKRSAGLPPRRFKPNKAFYQSGRWHSFSRSFRKKYPLCATCLKEGKTVLAKEVDHITPITAGGDKWDLGNLQSLCKSCHSKKTKKEQQNSQYEQE